MLREVIETDRDEALPVVGNATRAPGQIGATPGPDATPTPSPTPAEETWSYPSASLGARSLDALLEDRWGRDN